jgi:ABC-type multidrug transport system fused ATPase/permease subunit
MTSVERVSEYISLEKEDLTSSRTSPHSNWPANGEVLFNNVSFSYDVSLPNVLKNLTLKINAREKVGIVGRTGAGKSTLFQSLFRMAEPDGFINIDGINTKDISLKLLRRQISIIPVINKETCFRHTDIRFIYFFI